MKMKTKPSYFNVNQTLTWMTAIGSFASLVGIVIVAAELFKYQESVSNMNTIAGALMMFVGFALNFFTLIYQFFKLVEATSGPVNICFNCLSFMLGISILIVGNVLPLSIMFEFLAHRRTTSINGKEIFTIIPWGSLSVTLTTSETEKQGKPFKRRLKRGASQLENGTNSNVVALEHSVLLRVTTFSIILIVLGAVGISISCVVILRLHARKREDKKMEEARRKASQPNHSASKFQTNTWKAIEMAKRGSVYDYTAWDSRSKDLFSDRPMSEIEEETQTSTINNDGTFNHDLISESRLSSNFTFTSPFEKATTLIKGAKKFTDNILPSPNSKEQHIKTQQKTQLKSLSENCNVDQIEMASLSPTNLTNTTAFRRSSSHLEDETFSL